jgi:hypothetical protein
MKIVRWFLYSAAAVLLLTTAAKLISSAGNARILLEHDPVTNFQFRNLLRVIGSIETAVAMVCIFMQANLASRRIGGVVRNKLFGLSYRLDVGWLAQAMQLPR